ncbi:MULTISPECIES: TRAP transporter substrate-binding protein [unclassified Mesorhizobium]|uniref:TRAP transporter substrate-binding protein n=1 Tax=unclassified Mesorhizobium TaxID=325217 RepID=UPI0006F5F561|nr:MULTISPECIES: TRAP transporter substrate-binding protein [unclassified Mesorhizobium]KQZ13655.1 ABC transporter substrate-binding protein [Mesorhizobium sp. Root1471]KQZ36166.1 ABC transporter substrate-binding protein [Mesorhizobium sp. Root554]MDR7032600.1 tripartite ATP-independent transporter DctP family solute receptor [Mesorhizobium sp. BE184]
MNITRRSLVLGAAAAVPLVSTIRYAGAQTAEFNYKFANNLAVSHPLNIRAQEAVKKIQEETSGRVAIQIFPSSQLGADTDMLSQIRSGGVEFFTLSPLILSTLVKNASISGIGFAFPDYKSVWAAMDGDLGKYVRGEIEKSNLVVLDKIWDNGFRQITSSVGPIEKAADLKGFKIRVPVSPLWTSMFSAFESAPASINFAEVYSALQTKIVDGQENPLAIISTSKLYEVQQFCSMTNHMWDGFWFLANKRAWERMPEDVRGIVAKNINEAGVNQRADVEKLNSTTQEDLAAKGMKINATDPASFRDKLKEKGFYAEWKGKFGDEAWGILEKAVGTSLG